MSTFVKDNFGKWRTWGGLPIESFPLLIKEKDNTIPLIVAEEAYKEYAAQFGTQQTLNRLGERGGFGVSELAILLFERIKKLDTQLKNATQQSQDQAAQRG